MPHSRKWMTWKTLVLFRKRGTLLYMYIISVKKMKGKKGNGPIRRSPFGILGLVTVSGRVTPPLNEGGARIWWFTCIMFIYQALCAWSHYPTLYDNMRVYGLKKIRGCKEEWSFNMIWSSTSHMHAHIFAHPWRNVSESWEGEKGWIKV